MFTKLVTKINSNNEIEASFKIYKGSFNNSNKFKEETQFKILNGLESIIHKNKNVGIEVDSSYYTQSQLKDLHYYNKFLSFLNYHDIEYINVNDGFSGSNTLKRKNIRIYDCIIYNNGLNQVEFKYKSKLIELSNKKQYLFLDHSEIRSFEYFTNISNYKLVFDYKNQYYMINGSVLSKYIDSLKKALDIQYYDLYAIRIPFDLFIQFESIKSLNKKVRINESIIKKMIELHKELLNDIKFNNKMNYFILPCERSFYNKKSTI